MKWSQRHRASRRRLCPDVVLRVNENRRIPFTMEIGQLAEQVVVEASAVAVDVATGTTSQLIEGTGYGAHAFERTQCAAVRSVDAGCRFHYAIRSWNNNSSVNGIRPTHNAWLIDGGYNIDTGGNWGSPLAPNIETVAEFRAIRGNYSAEFGTGGGSQFNVISKGGTNDLHGSLYYFHRNDKLNAQELLLGNARTFQGQ